MGLLSGWIARLKGDSDNANTQEEEVKMVASVFASTGIGGGQKLSVHCIFRRIVTGLG